jgi:hypothetical protein
MKLGLSMLMIFMLGLLTFASANKAMAETEDETIESAEGDSSVPIYDSEEGSVDESSADVEE